MARELDFFGGAGSNSQPQPATAPKRPAKRNQSAKIWALLTDTVFPVERDRRDREAVRPSQIHSPDVDQLYDN